MSLTPAPAPPEPWGPDEFHTAGSPCDGAPSELVEPTGNATEVIDAEFNGGRAARCS